jgi:hypothetical protein
MSLIELELQNSKKLATKIEVEQLFKQSSGKLTCYWRTENSTAFFDHIRALQVRQSTVL